MSHGSCKPVITTVRVNCGASAEVGRGDAGASVAAALATLPTSSGSAMMQAETPLLIGPAIILLSATFIRVRIAATASVVCRPPRQGRCLLLPDVVT